MSVRSFIVSVLAVLWLWPAAAYGQSPALMDAYKRSTELYTQGRYQQALPFAEKVLKLAEHEFGSDHPATATTLNNLAQLYLAQGKYAEAEPLYERSLAIREKALGPEHPHVVQSLKNYAAMLRKTGRGEEAEKLEARAKAIRAKHTKENPAK